MRRDFTARFHRFFTYQDVAKRVNESENATDRRDATRRPHEEKKMFRSLFFLPTVIPSSALLTLSLSLLLDRDM